MRIISSFKDYYDHAMSFGQDPSLVYAREPAEIRFSKTGSFNKHEAKGFESPKLEKFRSVLWKQSLHLKDTKKWSIVAYNFFVVLAGKLYYGVMIDDKPFYSYEQACAELAKYEFTSYGATNILKEKEFKELFFYNYHRKTGERLEQDLLYADCLENEVVCMVIKAADPYNHQVVLEVNPCLRDLSFHTVVPAFECAQEIEMFLSALTVNKFEKLPVVADKYKIIEHGFDEVSFRPTSRKE